MIRVCLFLAALIGLSACSETEKVIHYQGPQVTKIEVFKEQRQMRLLHADQVLKEYDIELGFLATGHKQFEGDGRTPEGRYLIDRRNPRSDFHLSLGISYPNARDISYAVAKGKDPGGDIFIHGEPRTQPKRDEDWTEGCIALTNEEIREVYSMVPNGTVIDIFP